MNTHTNAKQTENKNLKTTHKTTKTLKTKTQEHEKRNTTTEQLKN